MTFGSLFSGIGGFDLGFERAGFVPKWQVEIDEFCRRVLAKHWPNVLRHDDVETFPPEGSGLDGWRVDVVIGGFPCQDVSTAGKRAGIGEGTRSGLWSEFRRVVALLRPRYVVVENTPGLLAPFRVKRQLVAPAAIGRVLGELSEIGFDAEWQVVPASVFGAPHRRERVFVIAYPAGHGDGQRRLPEGPWAEGQGAADAVGAGEIPGADFDRQGLAIGQSEQSNLAKEQPSAVGASGEPPVNPFLGSGWWGAEPDVVRMVHGVPRRLVRPAITGLGNAVVPQVAEWIARRLIDVIQKK